MLGLLLLLDYLDDNEVCIEEETKRRVPSSRSFQESMPFLAYGKALSKYCPIEKPSLDIFLAA